MSIDREESLFLTVSENHQKRDYPEYIRIMSQPYRQAGGMIAAYEGVVLGGADKLFGLDELNLWLRRHRFAAFNMHILVPITRLCLEYAVRRRLEPERPGVVAMAEQAAREMLQADPLQLRRVVAAFRDLDADADRTHTARTTSLLLSASPESLIFV